MPEIQVDPAEYDFGQVETGTSETAVITIYNLGDTTLALNDVYFESGSSGDFTITSFLYPPVFMGPGAQFPIEVTYTPTAGGPASATLLILSSDADESEVGVLLIGEAPSEEQTPEEQIAAILDFVKQSVQDGTLQGLGPGKSAKNRLNAFRNMLNQVQKLIDQGWYDQASDKLESIYKKTDGKKQPVDFVTGTAAAELAQMIRDLIGTLDIL